MTGFIGDFSNDSFQLLLKGMEIIDSKFSLFFFIVSLCGCKCWCETHTLS